MIEVDRLRKSFNSLLAVDDVSFTVGEGEIFGAMAALTNADRSATVRAKTNCSVVKVPKEQFTELIKSNPATIHSLLVDMANSIVNLNEQLVGLRFRALSYLADDCGEDVTPLL